MKKYSLDIKSEVAQIPIAIDTIKKILPLDKNLKLSGIELCIQEALSNAIIHGNANDASKEVKVNYFILDEMLHVIVEDEGVGVSNKNRNKSLKSISEENLLDESGRGIMLMKHFCSDVKFDKSKIELILSLKGKL